MIEVGGVVEHPRSDHAIEAAVAKRQVDDVADDHLDTAGSRQLHHPRRLIERDDAR